MKWFKHISDSLDDPFIFDLMDEFGDFGYVAFFGIIEIYSREFRPEKSEELRVKVDYIRQKLRQKRAKKLLNFLEYMERSRKWRVTFKDTEVIIFIPKFHDLADEWTRKKLRSDSGQTPTNLRHEVEVEEDKEEDKETTKEKSSKKESRKKFIKPTIQQIAEYCKERNNNIDPQLFFDHYEARNWKPKGYTQQMTDWKASVRTWEKNNNHKQDATQQSRDTAMKWANNASE